MNELKRARSRKKESMPANVPCAGAAHAPTHMSRDSDKDREDEKESSTDAELTP